MSSAVDHHIVRVRLVSVQMTVDATPVVVIAVGTVACRAPNGGTAAAYRATAASLVCAIHGQRTPQRVVVQVIRAPHFLARHHST